MSIFYPALLNVPLFLSGCRLIKMSSAEKVKANDHCEQIMLDGNRVIVPAKIEGKGHQLALDMGHPVA